MRYCIQCNKPETMCGCTIPHIVNNTINLNTAGRDGLDAKAIVIRSGKLREGASDAEFVEAITGPAGPRGPAGPAGSNGIDGSNGGMYTETEW